MRKNLPDKHSTGVKQSTITNHFITSKGHNLQESERRKKPLSTDVQETDESCFTDSKRAKTSNLSLSDSSHFEIAISQNSEIINDLNEENDDDIQLSQCCTQPLFPNDDLSSPKRNAKDCSREFNSAGSCFPPSSYINSCVLKADLQKARTQNVCSGSWLHEKSCIAGQKLTQWTDSVHGTFEIPQLCIDVINTPQFQVLQQRKQLGATYFAMRNATHTRFEHSVGVMYLAGRLVKTLQHQLECARAQRTVAKDGEEGEALPEISGADLLCVMLAGLCHDLGHGPFSHAFESVAKRLAPPGSPEWTHEENSVRVLRHLLAANSVNLADYAVAAPNVCQGGKCFFSSPPVVSRGSGLDPVVDLAFIEEMIAAEHAAPPPNAGSGWTRRGRGEDKAFLYQVVCCAGSGFDVDKLDYLLRDSLQVLGTASPAVDVWVNSVRVCVAPDRGGRLVLAWPEELAGQALEVFRTRYRNHLDIYTHSDVVRGERMVQDLLLHAAPHLSLLVAGPDGEEARRVGLVEALWDPEAFTLLDDGLPTLACQLAAPASAPGPRAARRLWHRLMRRKLYEVVAEVPLELSDEDLAWLDAVKAGRPAAAAPSRAAEVWATSPQALAEEIARAHGDAPGLSAEDLVVDKRHVHHGCGAGNPVAAMRFFSPRAATRALARGALPPATEGRGGAAAEAMRGRLPRSMEARWVRVLAREPDHEAAALLAVQAWRRECGLGVAEHGAATAASAGEGEMEGGA